MNARSTHRRHRSLKALAEAVRTLHADRAGHLDTITSLLVEHGLVDRGMAYSIGTTEEAFCLSDFGHAGLAAHARAFMSHFVGRPEAPRWGYFNPARPEARQRNRAVRIDAKGIWSYGEDAVEIGRSIGMAAGDVHRMHSGIWSSSRAAGPLGAEGGHQLRVLVCDGPALLAWVGGFTFDPVSAAQQRALTALVPALQDRLRLEQQLAPLRARAAALDLALEQVPGAAFLIDGAGQVRCTNSLGRSRLDRDPRGLAAALQLAVRQRASDAAFVVSPLLERGHPAYHLLVERPAVAAGANPTAGPSGAGPADRGADPADSWSLTPREREVFSLLLDGMANRSIALCLDCSERTVETHVSRILAKAGVETRAQLIGEAFRPARQR